MRILRFTPLLWMILLTACSSSREGAFTGPERNYEIIQQSKYLYLDFAPTQTTLDDAQKTAIREFLIGHEPQFGQRIAVSFMANDGDTTLASGRSQTVRDFVRGLGYAAVINGTVAEQKPDQVVITHHTPQARVPGCPDWQKTSGYDYTNTVYSNFNCANASNLGAMVANPMDLVKPAAMSAPDAPGAVLPLQRFRTDKVKELLKDTATKKEK